jgi:uncharacterized protein involved in type VI secretion and phage assembly
VAEVTEEIRPGSYVVDDFNFTTPKADLLNVRSQPRGTTTAEYEMYEWMGGYSDAGQGEHYARVRLEEAQALAERASAMPPCAAWPPATASPCRTRRARTTTAST